MKVKKVIIPLKYGANVEGLDLIDKYLNEELSNYEVVEVCQSTSDFQNNKFKNLKQVVKTAEKLSEKVQNIIDEGDFPLIIGGDHSVSLGSVSASLKKHSDLGLIWIDAHGDMNTPLTSLSGNIHGMVISSLIGLWNNKEDISINQENKRLNPKNIVIIGVRDLDYEEKKLIEEQGIKYVLYKEVSISGIEKTMKSIIEYLSSKVKKIHISFDLDSLNPKICPGVSVPVSEGFSINDIDFINKVLFKNFEVKSYDIVEYNPLKDVNNMTKNIVLRQIDFLENLINQKNKQKSGD